MAAFAVGTRIEQELTLDEAAIRAGARLVGDMNPLHHDAAFAAASRFGGLIASGAHTAALLSGFAATGFDPPAKNGRGSVGVDYGVAWRAPVRAGQRLRLEWTVTAIEPKRAGAIGRLEGRIADAADGATLLAGRMTVLIFG